MRPRTTRTVKGHAAAALACAFVVPALAAEAADDGLTLGASVIAVGQNINAAGAAAGATQSMWTLRGDFTAQLAAGNLAGGTGLLFGHIRAGQGAGVATVPSYTGAVNSTSFGAAAHPHDSYAVVAQAYYQLEWPVGAPKAQGAAGDRVVFNIGKMDLFGLFDQNDIAADESSKFLNNVFVHNPMLDSGGDTAADPYGFAPGLRLGYFHTSEGALGWGASVGVFGAGT